MNLQTQVNRSDVSSGTGHHKPARMKSAIANVPNSFSAPIQSSMTSPTQPQVRFKELSHHKRFFHNFLD